MADGADQLFARSVLALGGELVFVQPRDDLETDRPAAPPRKEPEGSSPKHLDEWLESRAARVKTRAHD